MRVRLNGDQVDGFTNVGYLEVFYDGLWGNVCADDWTKENSFVACGNLGYPDVVSNISTMTTLCHIMDRHEGRISS